MNGKYVFQVLEIEPTDDIKEIKKAYARMVKKYHPEEYPEKWKEIHDAYEAALKIAKQGQHIETVFHVKESRLPPEVISEKAEEKQENHQHTPVIKTEEKAEAEEKQKNQHHTPVTKTEEKAEIEETTELQYEVEQETPEDKSLISMFENIEDLSQEQQDQNRREKALKQRILREKLEDFKEMAVEKKFDGDAWENYFNQEDILPIISQKEFLFQMGNFFLYKKINRKKYKFLMKQLARIEEYHEEHNITFSDDEPDPIEHADSRIWEAYRTYIIKRIIVFALICLLVLAALHIGKRGLTTEQKREKRVEAIERQKRKDGERMYGYRVDDYNWYEENHSWAI
ncbi:MAG: DnaJ domain-containing protein [Lachnospiraceae bacterium]|nr:DnaJ domain-containing protein [Lachnospiraceae bacterium]